MKILMLCYEFPPLGGGGSRVVSGLSRELVRQGHRVDLYTMGFRGLPRRETVGGVDVHRVPCVRLREYHCTIAEAMTYVVSLARHVPSAVGREAYDINHTHFMLPDGLVAWRLGRRTGLPYLITVHGSDVPGYNPDRLRLAHRMLAPLWRRIAAGASRIVCPSASIRELVQACDDGLPTAIIPYGFEPRRYATHRPRERRILVVTRMLKRKGVQYLLAALEGSAIGHELHVVGDGPYLAELRERARKSKTSVVFHGWLDNRSEGLARLYETSEIFVLPSEAENFPVALMEAMAAELAIVTTAGTGCAEVVGEAAIRVEPRNPAQIRQAIETLADHPQRARELGRAAGARLHDRFAWPVIARQYVEAYEQHRRPASQGGA